MFLDEVSVLQGVIYIAVQILKPHPANRVDVDFQEKILNEIELLEGVFHVDDVRIEYKSLHDVKKYDYITQRLTPKRHDHNRIFVFQMSISDVRHLIERYGLIDTRDYLHVFVYALAYALGVYCDGVFDVDESVICYGDVYESVDRLVNSFSHLYEKDGRLYSTPTEISLQRTLDWFLSIDDVLETCGRSALGKSLSIYSRMFSSTPWEDELFMGGLLSVMALEALYESHGKRADLAERVAMFLNVDKQKCKHEIFAIYTHRCSVAHGGFVLPFKFNIHDGTKEFENAFDETQSSFDVGLHYLLGSYRKMIIQNKKELIFV